MAVILTNMDMPKNCNECYFQHSPSYRMWVCPNGCPLKSADEMIKEIEKAKWIDKDTRLVKNCNASGLEVALKIIHEYTDKEQGRTDGDLGID